MAGLRYADLERGRGHGDEASQRESGQRELAGGERHSYHVMLSEGQFMKVEIADHGLMPRIQRGRRYDRSSIALQRSGHLLRHHGVIVRHAIRKAANLR